MRRFGGHTQLLGPAVLQNGKPMIRSDPIPDKTAIQKRGNFSGPPARRYP